MSNVKLDWGCRLEDKTVKSCEPSPLTVFQTAINRIEENNPKNLIKLDSFVVSPLELTQEMSNRAFGGTTTIGNADGDMKLRGYQVNFSFNTKGNYYGGSLKVIYYYAPEGCSNQRTLDYTQEHYATTINGKFHNFSEDRKAELLVA